MALKSNIEYKSPLTLRSGLAISGNILQKGLIISRNLTETYQCNMFQRFETIRSHLIDSIVASKWNKNAT